MNDPDNTLGAVILALDLYRASLSKFHKNPDPYQYAFLIEHGEILVRGIQDLLKLFADAREIEGEAELQAYLQKRAIRKQEYLQKARQSHETD